MFHQSYFDLNNISTNFSVNILVIFVHYSTSTIHIFVHFHLKYRIFSFKAKVKEHDQNIQVFLRFFVQ